MSSPNMAGCDLHGRQVVVGRDLHGWQAAGVGEQHQRSHGDEKVVIVMKGYKGEGT